ncbi:serine/threonine-protein phosphatase with EF-hands 2 isoform X4 [Hemitrygon akajei]|uniref:serine/threonine-protein phosphatase with EF-hands 2 isoform X4 n=1 Tax=Hemitrygon akajei TaxID=2704970 RepID=UPI003BF95B89
MGCGSSRVKTNSTKKAAKEYHQCTAETAIKAAILIQRWYRQYVARLEVRRRCTWTIFQSIEYAGEQDQIKLHNFFSCLLDHFTPPCSNEQGLTSRIITQTDETCKDNPSAYDFIEVSDSYIGPQLCFPLTPAHVTALLEAFKKKQQRLHARYVLQLLSETRKHLEHLPNINQISTCYSKEITICGDLHGKLDDLFLIFYKNGLPSPEKVYVFNGDYVDRGKHSIEILLILFAFLLVYPKGIYLNRGNHEDHIINLRYGFTKEVMQKYQVHGTRILKLLQSVFSWLPLATVIDEKVLIIHGGISETTDLNFLGKIDRHKIVDILWSDPMHQEGCIANSARGGGCYFGPDVTEKILRKHNLQLLIRSHECKQEGYEYCHNQKVLTIFSASNYYEIGSNRGAYVKLGPDLVPHFMQYQVNQSTRKLTLRQRVSRIERSALGALQEKIFAHKSDLISAFKHYDKDKTGQISLNDWANALESILGLGLPWRVLRSQLVPRAPNGLLNFYLWFDDLAQEKPIVQHIQPSLLEMLYKSMSELETIFQIIDSDNSGQISYEEFKKTWKLLSSHLKIELSDEAISNLARSMDFNKDGSIDINEFLEAFRLVDKSNCKD